LPCLFFATPAAKSQNRQHSEPDKAWSVSRAHPRDVLLGSDHGIAMVMEGPLRFAIGTIPEFCWILAWGRYPAGISTQQAF